MMKLHHLVFIQVRILTSSRLLILKQDWIGLVSKHQMRFLIVLVPERILDGSLDLQNESIPKQHFTILPGKIRKHISAVPTQHKLCKQCHLCLFSGITANVIHIRAALSLSYFEHASIFLYTGISLDIVKMCFFTESLTSGSSLGQKKTLLSIAFIELTRFIRQLRSSVRISVPTTDRTIIRCCYCEELCIKSVKKFHISASEEVFTKKIIRLNAFVQTAVNFPRHQIHFYLITLHFGIF